MSHLRRISKKIAPHFPIVRKCRIETLSYAMHGQLTARGPNPARQGFSSGPPINFLGL